MRDLVAANGELKLNARRAKAEISVLKAERKGLEERFLLRTPSPPPMPPVGDIPAGSNDGNLGAAASPPGLVGRDGERIQDRPGVTRPFVSIGVVDDGNNNGMDWMQHLGDSKIGGDVESRGGLSSASIGVDQSAAGVLNRASPNDVVGHSESNNTPIRAPERGQVDGDPGFETNSGSERDAPDNSDSRDLDVNTTGAGSRPSEGVNLDNSSDSNKCDTREKNCAPDLATISERECQHGGPAEPSHGASCIEQVASASSTAEATCSAVDDAPKLSVTRPVNGHDGLSERLPPQHTGANLSSDNILLGGNMGGSGTSMVSTGQADNAMAARDSGHIATQSRRKRADISTSGSKGAVKSNTSLETGCSYGASGANTSVCEAESVLWPSASFIAAKASPEDSSDDEHGAQVTVDIPPHEESCSTVTQPSSKRRQLGNKNQEIIDYFLNDNSSQSSSDSRSPGG